MNGAASKYNTLIGARSGTSGTTGFDTNTAVGCFTLDRCTENANANVAIGYASMHGDFGTNDVVKCVAVGQDSLSGTLTSTAIGTVAVGFHALKALTSGSNNVAIGYQAMLEETTGGNNTVVGHSAMNDSLAGLENDNNTFIGYSSGGGTWLTTASNSNTAVGSNTMIGAMNDADYNTAMGHNALSALTLGDNNTAIGYNALTSGTSATENTIVGSLAGDALVGGGSNTIVGAHAGGQTTAVGKTVIIGAEAGESVMTTDAIGTVAVGYEALKSLTAGDANTAVGHTSLKTCSTGTNNTALGFNTLSSATGIGNTALGATAGGSISDGTHNIFIGYASGNHNINVSTGDFNTVIGSLSDTSAADAQGQVAIGYDVSCIANSTVTIGQGGNKASLGLDGSDTSWAATSDERYKENIETSTAGLSFVNDLRPITYNWKKEKDVPVDMPDYKEGSDKPVKGHEYGTTLHGFVAQEVKVAIDEHGEIKEGFKMWKEADDGVQTVAHGNLVPMLVKAVQELSAKVEALENA